MIAESLSIDLGTLLTIAGVIFGAGGVLATLKIRAALAEAKTKDVGEQSEKAQAKLERVDEKIFQEIKELGKTMQRRFNDQDQRQQQAEKSMVGKIEQFQSKVFRRFDAVQDKLSDHEKRLTVTENEAEHTKEKVERHARKITLFGKTPLKPPEDR